MSNTANNKSEETIERKIPAVLNSDYLQFFQLLSQFHCLFYENKNSINNKQYLVQRGVIGMTDDFHYVTVKPNVSPQCQDRSGLDKLYAGQMLTYL